MTLTRSSRAISPAPLWGPDMVRRPTIALISTAMSLLAATAGASTCEGRNLIDALPDAKRTQIEAAVADVPYHEGILWRATRGQATITMVGTYHFSDPRHLETVATLEDDLTDAEVLFVEAGPEEEARLTQALTEDPSLMIDPDGPTLPERLDDDEWQTLSTAMAERGSPAVVTAKMRPWYVAMMLGISPCMIETMTAAGDDGGLDSILVARAEALSIPVRALEPWDTVFTLFADLTPDEEEDMIRAALPAADYADDYAITLTDAYFRGDVWTIWEFGRFDAYDKSGMTNAEVDAQLDLAQTQLMDKRNRAWIAPLTDAADKAAQSGKGVLAGFGALHLPGESGVLRLLEKDGWTVERLDG
ncbi:TraB/GumN family protein [Paracoccus sp. TK19116]|uniref:TraB/GumN family protein n=1 Tax=Paracoccus albicereus TaxID=2922394 RepID=A0ABT1MU15_9RHOB|nr:TraB/GumN family protein [Paracoccus albicereus]MCQ0971812.1 TraB/GumN family protein [Paracoccus albicereus]